MLRIILLSLVWAICSTCLVRPWFWKGLIQKNLFNDYGERIGFSNEKWKRDIIVEVVLFAITFAISILTYCIGNRISLWGSFPMIILCFLFQIPWSYQGKIRECIWICVPLLCCILWIQDGIVGYCINPSLNRVDSVPLTALVEQEDTEVKLFVSANEIKSLFKASSIGGPTYNNGKYIFTVSGGANGDGIVVIDQANFTEAYFIPYSYGLTVREIRSQYPTKKLVEMYITVSDDNVPYGLFAMAYKTWFFGGYKVDGYVLLNMLTGETQVFTQEHLPIFVTNN